MKNLATVAIGLTLASLLSCSSAQANPSQFDGVWHNERKSEMSLKYDQKLEMITGTYKNRANTSTPETSYPLVGHVNGDVISFTVNWSKPTPAAKESSYRTLTSWTGQLVKSEGKLSLPTLFLYCQPLTDETGKPNTPLWKSIAVNSDTFEQGPASK